MESSLALGLVVLIVFAAIIATMADNRGRNPVVWVILGLFFGLFAIIALLLMGSTNRPRYS